MAADEVLTSPDTLLRHAARADAAQAVAVLARIPASRLLDLVVTQAELAVDDDRLRPAGIDAVGDLPRAAIEIMDLPQDADLDLDDPDELDEAPTITGWELVTTQPDELLAATVTLPVRPWLLALVAFADRPGPGGTRQRHAIGAAADGRLVSATMVVGDPLDDVEVVRAVITADPRELGHDAALAQALLAALTAAGRGA
ncbi:MAG: hypothetical protein JJT89_03600 [Nitriliruptoraceae bacterium]|nr:hypothetical protein [Nitriliruptoraceae bacterium]